MSGSAVLAAVALVAIPLAGWPAARLLGLRGALLVAASWLLGAGLLAGLMILASVLQLHYTRPLLALCWCVAVLGPCIAGLLARRLEPSTLLPWAPNGRSSDRSSPSLVQSRATARGGAAAAVDRRRMSSLPDAASALLRMPSSPGLNSDRLRLLSLPSEDNRRLGPGRMPGLGELLALAVCVFQLAFSFLQAVRVPLGSFDSWSLWEYRGRHFWLDGGLTGGFLHDHAAIFAHPAYPPLVPLLIAWVYTWVGAADPTLMKPLFPAFFAALLLVFYAALQPRVGARGALLATAALALVPRVAEYAGTGLADVPLAAALVAAAAAFVQWRQHGEWRALVAAGLLLGVALLTKREALFFALAGLLAVALLMRSRRALLAVALPAAIVGIPWYAYVRVTGVPDRDFLPVTLHNLLSHGDRLGEIARLFSLNLLAADEWSVLWYAFGALLLIGLVQRRLRAGVLLLPVLLPLALYVVSLSLSAWPDYTLHVRTSLDRLILVTTPFALWFIAEQVRPSRAL